MIVHKKERSLSSSADAPTTRESQRAWCALSTGRLRLVGYESDVFNVGREQVVEGKRAAHRGLQIGQEHRNLGDAFRCCNFRSRDHDRGLEMRAVSRHGPGEDNHVVGLHEKRLER